ncbi:hypothetical protein B0A48_03877 [Cryoendolithus antarcticus]|uniref:Aminoglycoside phosphotransferase domain-containing protein n=1 Tax=Cryoendolithus antarcticus TaxID=1507870 RepID=A0A1V8TGS2_9PEZI|nr:hypothetical protein B0A48_03877 [Cryoendolithus antarcticus]
MQGSTSQVTQESNGHDCTEETKLETLRQDDTITVGDAVIRDTATTGPSADTAHATDFNADTRLNTHRPHYSQRGKVRSIWSRDSEEDKELGGHEIAQRCRGQEADRGDTEILDDLPLVDINVDALKHIASYYLPGSHGSCTAVTNLSHGSFHDVRLLHFADGWTCIARLKRDDDPLEKLESELATVQYVRRHTKIPVPRTYFVNPNRNHAVGAAFTIIERVPGMALCDLYKTQLSWAHELATIEQISDAIAQLVALTFDEAGFLIVDGVIQPPHSTNSKRSRFFSTSDYFHAYLQEDALTLSANARGLYPEIWDDMHTFLDTVAEDPVYSPPFRLVHPDFATRNIMFSHDDLAQPPMLTGIIDWESSSTTIPYYAINYPEWIAPYPDENGSTLRLRDHFKQTLLAHSSVDAEERAMTCESLAKQDARLNDFREVFMLGPCLNAASEEWQAETYMNARRMEVAAAESDASTNSMISSDSVSEGGSGDSGEGDGDSVETDETS